MRRDAEKNSFGARQNPLPPRKPHKIRHRKNACLSKKSCASGSANFHRKLTTILSSDACIIRCIRGVCQGEGASLFVSAAASIMNFIVFMVSANEISFA